MVVWSPKCLHVVECASRQQESAQSFCMDKVSRRWQYVVIAVATPNITNTQHGGDPNERCTRARANDTTPAEGGSSEVKSGI